MLNETPIPVVYSPESDFDTLGPMEPFGPKVNFFSTTPSALRFDSVSVAEPACETDVPTVGTNFASNSDSAASTDSSLFATVLEEKIMFLLAPRAMFMAWSRVMCIRFPTPDSAGFVSDIISALKAGPVVVNRARRIKSILIGGIKVNIRVAGLPGRSRRRSLVACYELRVKKRIISG